MLYIPWILYCAIMSGFCKLGHIYGSIHMFSFRVIKLDALIKSLQCRPGVTLKLQRLNQTTYLVKVVIPLGVSDNMGHLVTHVLSYVPKETINTDIMV